jgi:hypothetical protein
MRGKLPSGFQTWLVETTAGKALQPIVMLQSMKIKPYVPDRSGLDGCCLFAVEFQTPQK